MIHSEIKVDIVLQEKNMEPLGEKLNSGNQLT